MVLSAAGIEYKSPQLVRRGRVTILSRQSDGRMFQAADTQVMLMMLQQFVTSIVPRLSHTHTQLTSSSLHFSRKTHVLSILIAGMLKVHDSLAIRMDEHKHKITARSSTKQFHVDNDSSQNAVSSKFHVAWPEATKLYHLYCTSQKHRNRPICQSGGAKSTKICHDKPK